jgi:molybdopterin synthase catalytic subunit
VTLSVRLARRPIPFAAVGSRLTRGGGGGIVVFAGVVRPDRVGSARVVALDYEVDPVPARRALERLERTARRRFGATEVRLVHRLGRVRVGEIAVLVAVACPHRAKAFDAAEWLIDQLKATVPIWKEVRARRAHRPRRPRARSGGRSAG